MSGLKRGKYRGAHNYKSVDRRLFDNIPLYLRVGKRRWEVISAFESDSMAKRDHTPPPSGTVSSAAPPEAIRMEFARRLQAALNERGWT